MIIYSKSTGLNPAACGRLETPIKMIIEHESDLLTKKGGICSWLFNVEKSGKFGIRTVRMEEKVTENKDGFTCQLYVNEKPVFMKGANWVPLDVMTGCIQKNTMKRL